MSSCRWSTSEDADPGGQELGPRTCIFSSFMGDVNSLPGLRTTVILLIHGFSDALVLTLFVLLFVLLSKSMFCVFFFTEDIDENLLF